jgi:hypothetical protein
MDNIGLIISVFNGAMLLTFYFGIYKNKMDHNTDAVSKVSDIDARLIRLEEKVNFIYQSIKQQR